MLDSKVQGTLVRRCKYFGMEAHTIRWEVSTPLMRVRYIGCRLADIIGELDQNCQDGQLEDIGLPSSGLVSIIESSPPGCVPLAHIFGPNPGWLTWSVHVRVKLSG